jgi:hypothetical protein
MYQCILAGDLLSAVHELNRSFDTLFGWLHQLLACAEQGVIGAEVTESVRRYASFFVRRMRRDNCS